MLFLCGVALVPRGNIMLERSKLLVPETYVTLVEEVVTSIDEIANILFCLCHVLSIDKNAEYLLFML